MRYKEVNTVCTSLKQNTQTGTQLIEFDGDNFFDTEIECYVYAMINAYVNKNSNECLGSVEFISC